MKPTRLVLLVTVFYALHQDVWFWRAARPLVFGFLPIGLCYHACYSVAAAGVLWLLVRYAWPGYLETRAQGDALIPALVVFCYLGVVFYIGIFAFRRSTGREGAEDFFLAGRSLGPFVFSAVDVRNEHDGVHHTGIFGGA
ncbi:MAG: hypothetical protein HY238_02090 [Acidobacteria bacterium]|nr:hypothetical protein [Acidobacteriota bacterium]